MSELRRLRAGIVTAAEAIIDGDADYALAVLQALETPPEVLRAKCPRCDFRAEWPGLLDQHLLRHSEPEEVRRAA